MNKYQIRLVDNPAEIWTKPTLYRHKDLKLHYSAWWTLQFRFSHLVIADYTSQQDFVPRKIYCVSNVTFHAESKYAIKRFPSPTVFVQWNFLLLIFRNFSYFLQLPTCQQKNLHWLFHLYTFLYNWYLTYSVNKFYKFYCICFIQI
jgi:hypothetical protein